MKKITLFVDLDGVLADFDAGVKAVTGKEPSELKPKELWGALARADNFFSNLDWMPDGKVLWDHVKQYHPIILTGLPLGKWAAPQKRVWCAQMLGKDVPVITCMAREKAVRAADMAVEGHSNVLIDDRIKARDPWVEAGGIFIHHINAEQSIAELEQLLNE